MKQELKTLFTLREDLFSTWQDFALAGLIPTTVVVATIVIFQNAEVESMNWGMRALVATILAVSLTHLKRYYGFTLVCLLVLAIAAHKLI